MQDAEQGPQSQVLFSASPFFNALCSQGRRYITSRQRTSNNIPTPSSCLHHSTAPGPSARVRRAGAGPGPPRRIGTGEPAATGAGRRSRTVAGGDERHAGRRRGERNHPRRAPPEPPPGRRRGEWDHARRSRSGRTAGGGRVRIHWSGIGSGMGRLCDVADEDTGGRRDPARGRISRARQGAARRARRRGAHGSLRRTRPRGRGVLAARATAAATATTRPRGRGVLDRAAPRTPRGRRARFLRTRVAGDDGDGRPALRPFGRPRRRSGES